MGVAEVEGNRRQGHRYLWAARKGIIAPSSFVLIAVARLPSLLRMLLFFSCLAGSGLAGAGDPSKRYVEYAGGKIHLFDLPGCWGNPNLSVALFDKKAEKNHDRALVCWRYQGNWILIFRSNSELPLRFERDAEKYETIKEDRPVPT